MSRDHEEADHGVPTTTPHWVKVFGIILIAFLLLVALILLIGGGEHGPGRHLSSSDTGGHAPSLAYGARQP